MMGENLRNVRDNRIGRMPVNWERVKRADSMKD